MKDDSTVALADSAATTTPASPTPESSGESSSGSVVAIVGGAPVSASQLADIANGATNGPHKVNPVTVEAFIALFGSTTSTVTFRGGKLRIDHINVLTQTRSEGEFDDIADFAQGIAGSGLLHPLIVVRFTPKKAREYVAWVNDRWKSNHRFKDLTPVLHKGRKHYLVLISGERRLRAFKYLHQFGCVSCLEHFGEEESKSGKCFRRHFGTGNRVEVRICDNISPAQAFVLQNVENTHKAVAAWREANAYRSLWLAAEAAGFSIPLTRFAAFFGRGVSTMRDVLRYAKLPRIFQEAVENGTIKYGHALALAELQECMEQYGVPEAGIEGVDESEIRYWLWVAQYKKLRVEPFRDDILSRIRTIKSGQTTLFGIMSAEQLEQQRRLARRGVVGKRYNSDLWAFAAFLTLVGTHLDAKELAVPGARFSETSPVRILRKIIPLLRTTLPKFQTFMPRDVYPQLVLDVDALDRDVPKLSEGPSETAIVETMQRILSVVIIAFPFMEPFIPGDERETFKGILMRISRQLPGGERGKEVAAGQAALM